MTQSFCWKVCRTAFLFQHPLEAVLEIAENGGKLQLDENIPYTAQMIATITRQQVGTVERALKIFLKLGLVEPLPSGALYMSNIELLIGQSSTEGSASAGRGWNCKKSPAKAWCGQMSTISSGHLSTRDRDRERDRYRVRERERGDKDTPPPPPMARYSNVFLSDTELAELQRGITRQMGVLY